MADEYISPFKEERELMDTYGAELLREVWLNMPKMEGLESNDEGSIKDNPRVKALIDATKECKGDSYQKLRAKKDTDLIKAEDILLENLLSASPKGSPLKTELNRFEFVVLFSDFDPSLFCLTSPASIKRKPDGDYHLLVYEKAYVQFINRSGVDLLDDKATIKWRIPKAYFPPDWTKEQRIEALNAQIKRTVVTPKAEDFHTDLKIDELNEDLSKFAYPKIERTEPEGWTPEVAKVQYLQEQTDWLSDVGTEKDQIKLRKDIKKAYDNIVRVTEDCPLWIKIVQTAQEFAETAWATNRPINPTRKAIKNWLLNNDEGVKRLFSAYKMDEGSHAKNKWDDNFRHARQLVYISEEIRS